MTPSSSDFDIAVQRLSRLATNPKTPASFAGDLALVLLAAKAHAAHLAKLDTSGLAERIADLAQYHHSIVMMGDGDNSFPVEMFKESIAAELAPVLETLDEHEKNLTLLRRLIGECTDKREVEALENKKLLEANRRHEAEIDGRVRDNAALRAENREQQALIEQMLNALSDSRDYVSTARGGTELSLTLEESEVRKTEIQKELESHTGLLSRIDALLKELPR